MNEKKFDWKPSPHTADLAMTISAVTYDDLFRAALFGLLGTLEIEIGSIPDRVTELRLTMASENIENALVDFLGECIYLMEVEDLIPFEIRSINFLDGNLDTVLVLRNAGKIDMGKIGHIKAVTYHDLNVIESDGVFRATIVFDT
ncbi:MAG: archease [bacterium]